MISMLDRDYSGKMGFSEYKELWKTINSWRQTFFKYDKDKTGTLHETELLEVLKEWKYELPVEFVRISLWRYDPIYASHMKLDDFISWAVTMKSATDHYRRRPAGAGTSAFAYDAFMQIGAHLLVG
uniref:EF-hand domain-containing protein n=1 Tax=Ciona savignyi TaxID=51511 RepID=H2YJR7_CIOSA